MVTAVNMALVRKAGDGRPIRAYLPYAEPYPDLGEAVVTFWARREGTDNSQVAGELVTTTDVSAPLHPAGTVWQLDYTPAIDSPYRTLAPGRYRAQFRVALAVDDYIYYPEEDYYIRLVLTPNLDQ